MRTDCHKFISNCSSLSRVNVEKLRPLPFNGLCNLSGKVFGCCKACYIGQLMIFRATCLTMVLRERQNARKIVQCNSASSLAYGTRARSAGGSQNCAILSMLCPFTGNGALLCVNAVVVDLPSGKDAIKVLFCGVNTKKYIFNTVLTTSYI